MLRVINCPSDYVATMNWHLTKCDRTRQTLSQRPRPIALLSSDYKDDWTGRTKAPRVINDIVEPTETVFELSMVDFPG